MSVVAIKKREDGFWDISADDIAVSGWTVASNADNATFSKLYETNGIIIGGSGSCEVIGCLFMYADTHILKDNSKEGVFDWFKDFLEWREKKTSKQGLDGNYFLIIKNKKAYYFENFLCVEVGQIHAIGAGRDFAFASLWCGIDTHMAVESACALSAMCSEPVHTIRSKEK